MNYSFDRLKDIVCRAKKRRSIAQVLKDAGIPYTTWTNWGRGVDPPVSKVLRLLEVCEVSPNEAFNYESEDEDFSVCGRCAGIGKLYQCNTTGIRALVCDECKGAGVCQISI